MKSNYIKKIIAGIVVFGSYAFFNSGFADDPDVFVGEILCFLLPALVLGGKRLYIWIISYSLSLVSFWYIVNVPQSIDINSACHEILCGMDSRPFYVIFLYISLLIILGIWQLVEFVKQRKLKNSQ